MSFPPHRVCVLLGGVALTLVLTWNGKGDAAEPTSPIAGHSLHGEAFNEGPRQAAYLMSGTGNIHFPVTTPVRLAQQFMDQGVGQLHGFWYFEAERSFRQLAALDQGCAMAYWGMAMANVNNRPRARQFLTKAIALQESLTPREKLYLEVWNAYFAADMDDKKSERGKAIVKGLEKIVKQFPEDMEAKAFLGCQIWKNSSDGIEVNSCVAVDALLTQVLEKNPLHPCHHYRIHLWDKEDPTQALSSAALCGKSAPMIAHMWHMPGHTYSGLHRYADAAWQQEASARTDHAYMVRDLLLPDQIHNYAHNNEWLIRNWIKLGRMHDALSLAMNLTELPRHPKFNPVSKNDASAGFGRRRILDVLIAAEWWEELLRLSDTPYLAPGTSPSRQIENARVVGLAAYQSHQAAKGDGQLEHLRVWLQQNPEPEKASADKPADADPQGKEKESDEAEESPPAMATGLPKLNTRQRKRLVDAIQELEGWQAWHQGHADLAWQKLQSIDAIPYHLRAPVLAAAGKGGEAETLLQKTVTDSPGEVLPLAHLAAWRWQQGNQDAARDLCRQLRSLASFTDLDLPALRRLDPITATLSWTGDWRVPYQPPQDFGERPTLDSLGPVRWSPPAAPDWSAPDATGQLHHASNFRHRNVVLILYLGFGCLHCVEQLNAFAPQVEAFRAAGWEILAIGTDSPEELTNALANYDKQKISFPLLADPALHVFRRFRCFDDFEQKPLHGTFLIDARGHIRWLDIAHQPFVDHAFLLEEAKRVSAAAEIRTSNIATREAR